MASITAGPAGPTRGIPRASRDAAGVPVNTQACGAVRKASPRPTTSSFKRWKVLRGRVASGPGSQTGEPESGLTGDLEPPRVTCVVMVWGHRQHLLCYP